MECHQAPSLCSLACIRYQGRQAFCKSCTAHPIENNQCGQGQQLWYRARSRYVEACNSGMKSQQAVGYEQRVAA